MKQKWRRLGRIYIPGTLPGLSLGHGLMPVAEHLAGSNYRVYFAGRDDSKKSQICSFDFDINTRQITNSSDGPLLQPGDMGTFDESGCVPSWIVRNGEDKYLYYVGWNTGGSVPFRLALGLAIGSDDGTFHKIAPGPIADRSLADPCLVGSCGGLREGSVWKFWYVSGVNWMIHEGTLRHRYHLKYAESDDGVNWRRNGRVAIDFADDSEYAFAAPRVLKTETGYRMWYCFRGDAYAIGYAESSDGFVWKRFDEQIEFIGYAEDWDSQMKCYPYVFAHNDQLFMLYNGNGYGETGIGLAVLEKSSEEQ